jgi:hypothetical protein
VADEPLVGQINAFALVGDDPADDLGAPSVALENGQHGIAILLAHENAIARVGGCISGAPLLNESL